MAEPRQVLEEETPINEKRQWPLARRVQPFRVFHRDIH